MPYDEDDERATFLSSPTQKEKPWNQFPDSPREIIADSMLESKWYNVSLKLLHLAAFLFTFVVVLGAATISKGTLLFMTSQVSHNDTKPYCNAQLDPNREFVVTLPATERVVWIWMLFYAYCVPQVGIFLRSVRICIFKKFKKPRWTDFFLVLLTETFPAIGSALLVFHVLPRLDVIKGAMLLNGFSFIPALLNVIMGQRCTVIAPAIFIIDCLALVCQATALIAWPLVEGQWDAWMIPIVIIFIAVGYWENFFKWSHFVKEKEFKQRRLPEDEILLIDLARERIFFNNSRYFVYSFISIWKMFAFFVTMLVYFWIVEGNTEFLFDYYAEAMNSHPIPIQEIAPVITSNLGNIEDVIATGFGTLVKSDYWTPIFVFIINVATTYISYIFGKFACKIIIQGFSFAFPVNLTMPLAISILVAMSGAFTHDACAFADNIPPYLFFDVPTNMYHLQRFLVDEWAWVWLLWALSQAWITRHIWTPSSERLARTERLYMRPMYDPFLIDQDVAMNRRKEAFIDDDDVPVRNEGHGDDISGLQNRQRSYKDEFEDGSDNTTRIYACGTMWHETKDEMMAFLKSILHLDADQCARKIASVEFLVEKDYYELETHIFFDDAFIRYDNSPEPYLNQYVELLIATMDEARRDVHEVEVAFPSPVKISTPYGGRLVWKLPGGTKFVAHLKDKKKIRAKKRWSQVMYMYYLLGYRLMDGNFSKEQKEIRSENTFVLALDGDIDFQPHAVLLLVDLMRKSRSVGAACGRIHPIGSGLMAWYQMFEYAIGHWMQKATEHVIGCVLCSPGCFSLFRGSALMEDNVMKRYTTEATEARHFVQYDQGEDRWLCTLLLQRGFRVEYSAASDSYTHCPEGFNEFYNQRRRWMPSTTANILDLLNDYKYITGRNENISSLYIFYQGIMMVGTVLGPGTIFLMLVGAFVAAFQMGQWESFFWNAVPIVTFMIVCKLFDKTEIQLFVAGLISAIYGLIMMAVLVGILMQIQLDGVLAPSSLFFFFTAGVFIITAMMHPKEFGCLLYGVIYYVTVPSMYLLLVVYSVFNMNNVSWGTRETVISTKKGVTEEDAPKEAPKTAAHKIWNFLGATGKEDDGAIGVSIASLCKCMLCTSPVSPEEERLIAIQGSLKKIEEYMEMPEEKRKEKRKEEPKKDSTDSVTAEEFEELNYWMDEGDRLKKCETGVLTKHERTFWNELIELYLKPDVKNDKEKKKIAAELADLRDKAVSAFIMINSLFVLVIFMLTLKKDILHLNWPFNVKTNFTYFTDSREITMVKQYLELEPIGFVFLIFFFSLMTVQFIAMFQHRFETMCQILSNMEFSIGFFQDTKRDLNDETKIKKGQRWIDAVKDLQRLRRDDDENNIAMRRTTVTNNQMIQLRLKNAKTTLMEAFKENYERVAPPGAGQNAERNARQQMVDHMVRRRTHVFRDMTDMNPRVSSYRPPGGVDEGGAHSNHIDGFSDGF